MYCFSARLTDEHGKELKNLSLKNLSEEQKEQLISMLTDILLEMNFESTPA